MTRIVLRNSLVPTLTFVGGELASLLVTTALIEFIFAWGGWASGAERHRLRRLRGGAGVVLVLSLFSIAVFAAVDLVVLVSEPRAAAR